MDSFDLKIAVSENKLSEIKSRKKKVGNNGLTGLMLFSENAFDDGAVYDEDDGNYGQDTVENIDRIEITLS